MVSVELVCGVIAILLASVRLFFTRKFRYWSNLGIAFIKPNIPFGNLTVFNKKCHHALYLQKFYRQLKGFGPIGGFYMLTKPQALILDLDVIRYILVKDFAHFSDRGIVYNERDDPLSAHLFSLEGAKWRRLRTHLTPTFTSAKMKFMFNTIADVGHQFLACLSSVALNDEFEVFDVMSRFTTDVLGACTLGIDCASLRDGRCHFRVMSHKILARSKHQILRELLIGLSLKIARLLRLQSHPSEVTQFFVQVVQDTIKHRERYAVKRNDFMDLLLQLMKNGQLDGDNGVNECTITPAGTGSGESMGRINVAEIAAQVFVFFLAGFETSSALLTFVLYELALNVEVQERARDEIRQVLHKYNGELTYEGINEMTYVEQILKECLRKYPPGPILLRRVCSDYQEPKSGYLFKRNQLAWIPVYAIHHDPEIYPDPHRFDPDRFHPEEVAKRHPMSFLAFGKGPRSCIGSRFGMVQSKVGLITILRSFEVHRCSRTPSVLEFNNDSLVLVPKEPLWLRLLPLK